MNDWERSFALLFALLNPFLMSVYLIDLIEELPAFNFARVLLRASAISASVFIFFAWAGERLFVDVLQVHFSSFQIFGGVVFSVIGLQFVMRGPRAIKQMRGDPEHVAGSIAMPFMIGPGTLSASVLIGERHSLSVAASTIAGSCLVAAICLLLVKIGHDSVRKRNAALVERYIDIVGRASALLVGAIAVEMICAGIEARLG